MQRQIHHMERGAIPPRWRDVDDIGHPAYPGKDSRRAGATSSARSITLGLQPNHNLVSHLEDPGLTVQIGSLLVRCILTQYSIMNDLMQLTNMLGKCDSDPRNSNMRIEGNYV